MLLSLLAVLAGAQPEADLTSRARMVALGYVAVDDPNAKPLCTNAQQLLGVDAICAQKIEVTTSHWRPMAKREDVSWTVQVDVVTFSSAAEAAHVRDRLVALAHKPDPSRLSLSWCPRSYFWQGHALAVVSAGCGGERPMCTVAKSFAEGLVVSGAPEPQGIFGLEGGHTALVRGRESLAKCP
ncbi:MAG: hypothetical protein JNK82_24095 [Myxococcaceae bacterium]|nr:hypothetical protein [Myxococcaceae bacterium]